MLIFLKFCQEQRCLLIRNSALSENDKNDSAVLKRISIMIAMKYSSDKGELFSDVCRPKTSGTPHHFWQDNHRALTGKIELA